MAYTFQPQDYEQIVANLPEYQKRALKAKRLRKRQGEYEAMRDKDEPLGEVTKGSMGSLYAIQGRYIPNTYGQVMKGIGGISAAMGQGKADAAEEELGKWQGENILAGVQQLGGGMPGGGAPQPGAQPPDVAAEMSGTLGLPNAMGAPATGAPPAGAPQGMQPPGAAPAPGAPPAGGTGGGPDLSGLEGMNPEQKAELQKTIASMTAMEMPQEVIDDYVARAVAKAQQTPGGQAGPVSTSPFPDSADPSAGAPQVEPQMAQALGMESQQPAPTAGDGGGRVMPTEATLKTYLGMIGGDEYKDALKGITGDDKNRLLTVTEDNEGNLHQQYTDGTTKKLPFKARSKNVKWVYDEYEKQWYLADPVGGMRKVSYGPPAGAQASRADGTDMTPEEVQATGVPSTPTLSRPAGAGPGAQRSDAENAALEAPIAVQQAVDIEAGKTDVEQKAKAKSALGKIRDSLPGVKAAMQRVVTSPHLGKVTAGGAGSFIPDREEAGGLIGRGLRAGYAAYDPKGSDLLQDLEQIRGGAFMQGFQSLVGQGAGSISNVEGQSIRDSLINISNARSAPAMRQAITEFEATMKAIETRLASVAEAQDGAQQGGGAAKPLTDDELAAKYLRK